MVILALAHEDAFVIDVKDRIFRFLDDLVLEGRIGFEPVLLHAAVRLKRGIVRIVALLLPSFFRLRPRAEFPIGHTVYRLVTHDDDESFALVHVDFPLLGDRSDRSNDIVGVGPVEIFHRR